MREEKKNRYRVFYAIVMLALIFFGTASSSVAAGSEALYVDTSSCSIIIYNAANCNGAPDGIDAYISGPISNSLDIWTFNFANIPDSSADFDSANIYITYWVSTHENDVLVWEYFDGTNWNIIQTFDAGNPPPVVRTTSGPFSADSIKNWSQVDGFQLRLRGVNKVGGSDVITWYVDAAELRVSYNQAPVLDPIGSRVVDEGQTLEFRVSATDPDLDALTLTAENLPANAAFFDSGNGAGLFTFDPDYTQAGVHNVTFIASDGLLADSESVAITVNKVNRVPVLDSIGARSVDEVQTLEFRISATDPDGDALILSAENVPANATFVDSGNGAGSFTFDPDYTQAGVYNVTVIASDGTLADSESVAITVNNVNRVPVLDSIGAKSIDEAQTLEFRVSATDPDLDAITLTAENIPTNAAFYDSGNGAGSFAFNPDYTQAGVHNVTFIASDGTLADSELVTVTVNNVNRSPLADAGPDQLTAEAGFLVTLDGSGSSDPDGDSIGYHWLQISGLTVALSDSNAVNPSFTPDIKGNYEFELLVDDASLVSFPDTVLVSVNNQPPVLDSIGAKSVDEGQTLEFRVSATDADGDSIILSAEDVPTNATFIDSGNGAGSFTFNPDYTQAEVYNVTFISSDGLLADSELVTITINNVNRFPVLDSIGSRSIDEGQTLGFRVSGTDPDGDSLILTAENVPLNATFVDSGNGAGSFSFNPTYDQAGIYNVTFIASDGTLADSELVAITVNDVNRSPVLDSIGSKSVDEAQTLEFRVHATDPDGDSIILSAENIPINASFIDSGNGAGSFTFNPDYDQAGLHNVNFIASDGSLADSELVSITVNDVNRVPVLDSIGAKSVDEGQVLEFRVSATDADGDSIILSAVDVPTNASFVDSGNGAGSFSFNPDYDQAGLHNVTFIASDELLADSGSVAVTVNDVNRLPVLDSIGSRGIDEGQTLGFMVSATDPDGDSIILTAEDVPLNATFVDSGNGAGSFSFNPDYTQAGVYNVTFIASDGLLADSELVAVTVNDVNRLPVLDSVGAKSVDEGQVLEFRVSATDPDGDSIILTAEDVPLNASFVDSGNGAGSFSFNPDYAQAGLYNVTFIATDTVGAADSELVAITVNNTNRDPVLASIGSKGVDEGQTLEFRISSSDPDLDSIILSAVDVPTTNATFFDSGNGAGSFTFNPDYAQAGLYNVTFIATDTVGAADSEVVAITVNNVNLPPVLASIGSKGVDEGQTLEFRISSSDPDLDSIILSAVDVPTTNATFFDSGNGAGSFTFNPDYAQAGLYNVTFIATDTVGAADSEVVAITVNNVNLPPVLASIGSKGVDEGQTLEFRISSSDPDLDSIILSAVDVPTTNATFFDSGNGAGSFTFNPDYAQAGLYNVTFIATDTVGAADSELVAITVNNTNRDPVLASIGSKGVDEGQTLEFRISSSDPDLDSIILSAVDVPTTNATFFDSGNGAGSFTFNPDYAQAGLYNVTFIATDTAGAADSEVVAITVNDINNAPVLDSIGSQSVDEGQVLSFRVHATDINGDSLILSALDAPVNATFTDSGNGSGSFSFSPDYTQSGLYNVTFIATDTVGAADSELVAITVNNTNRDPVLASIGSKGVDEGQTLEFRISSSDPDLDSIILSAVDVPTTNATFFDSGNGAGLFTFNPDYAQAGLYNVTFIASDGSLADSELVTVTVNDVNRTPVADVGPDQVDVEAGLLVTLVGSGSYDPDGDSIGYHWAQISGSTVTLSDTNAVNPSFTPDIKGNYEFELKVDDGVLMSLPDTVLVSVSNQAPVLDSIGAKSVDEGQTLSFRVSATDADGDSIILSASDVPPNATFTDSGNGAGSFTFSPDYTQANIYGVTFIASDGGLADSESVSITVNDINSVPVLDSIGSQSVDEGLVLTFRVHATDINGDSLILSALDVPVNASFTDSGNGAGSFSFSPDYTQSGMYNVTFIATDTVGAADSELVAITVNDINNAPVLDSIGSQSVDEGQVLSFRVYATDINGDSLILSALDVPVNATFTDSGNGSGSFSFSPDYTQSGVHNVTFIAADTVGAADSELVAITVNDINNAPVLDSIGSQSVDEGLVLSFRVSATDINGDSLIWSALDVPVNASFTDSGNGSGSFSFSPDYTQSGVYNVTFIAADTVGAADSELVVITVNDINNSPVLDSIGSQSVNEGQVLTFRVHATDVNGDSLIWNALDVPVNASFTDSGNGSGSFGFSPDYTQSGVYNVTFIATDTVGAADSELVAITVNDINNAPVLDSIGSQSVDEGQVLSFRVSATDINGDSLILSALDVPVNASFTDSGNGSGSFSFSPDYTQSGVYNVTFIATDTVGAADSELVVITVNDINNSPVLDSIGSQSVDEGQVLTFRIHATDINGDSLILSALDEPVNASFTDSGNGSGSFSFSPDYTQSGVHNVTFIATDTVGAADSELVAITVNDINNSPVLDSIGSQSVDEGLVLTFRVHATDINGDSLIWSALDVPVNATFIDSGNGSGSFSFSPDYTQSGLYNVTFIATDTVGAADSELVAITVNNTNRDPVLASIGSKGVDEGQTLEFRISSSDPDLDSIILSAVDVPTTNATFFDSGNGAGSFTFNPDYAQAGLYNVTFIATDTVGAADSELVAITVNDVNRAPVADAGSDQLNVDAGTLVALDGSGSSDPDGDSIGYHWVQISGLSVTLSDTNAVNPTFTPTVKGSYEFELRVDDALLMSLSDTVLVSVSNQAPVLDSIGSKFVDEGQTLELRVSATDLDGDAITLSAENVPINATFVDSGNGAGSFTFNPDYTQANIYDVTFIASDGGLADSELVSITVNHINLAPVLDSIGSQVVDEGSHLEIVVTSSDFDNDSLILTAEGLPPNSAFTDSGNGHGLFVFDPDYNQAGVHNVTFIASDGSLADSELVAITVNHINLAPILDSIGPQFVDEGSHLEVVVTSSDFDNDSLTLTAEGLPVNAAFTDSGNGHGLFEFDPDSTQSGVYPVRFIVTDGALADSGLVDITVNQVNLAPILDSIGPQFVDEGSHLEVVVTSSDFDNDSLTLTAEGLPVNAAFTDSGNGHGLFEFDPDSTQSGVYPVRFIVTDGALADSELVDVTVNQVNLAPVLDSIGPQFVDEGSHLEVVVTSSDFDNDSLILTAEGLPANSAFTDSGNGHGLFVFDPDFTQSRVYPVRFIVGDGTLADSELVDITVNQVNLAPQLDSIPTPQTVNENQLLEFDVSATDFDGTTPILSAYGLPDNASFIDHGDSTGTFSFTPDYFQAGSCTVLFEASDGELADSQYVDISVNNVNRSPTVVPVVPQTVDEGGYLTFPVNADDPDLETLTLVAQNLMSNATFVDSGNNVGLFEFYPDYTQTGFYIVRFVASDGQLSDTIYVDITVNDVNRAPIADAGPDQVAAEAGFLVTLDGSGSYDPDGDSIGYHWVQISGLAVTLSDTNAVNPSFTPDIKGNYEFELLVDDAWLVSFPDTVLVSVSNQAPVLDSIGAKSVDEGQTLEFRVSATDLDLDSVILTAENVPTNAAFIDSGNGAGSFTFSPDYTQTNIYDVTFIAWDGGLADSELVSITVNDINNAAVLDSIGSQSVDEGQVLEFRVSATDINGDSIILSASNVPSNASFMDSGNGSGSFSFSPDYTQSGIYNVTFIATDTVGAADSELVAITVNDINNAPVLDSIGSRSVDEGQVLGFRVSATDINGDSIILSATNVPTNASFTDSGNGSGSFSFGPDYAQSGIYNVTFIATDTVGAADSELVAITVNDINQAPVLDPIGSRSVDEGQTLGFRVSTADPDIDSIILSAEDVPVNATFVDSGNGAGSFAFNPTYDQAGVYNVTFIASDGSLADSEAVAITVNDVNQAPVLDSIGSRSVDEGQSLEFRVSAADPDLDSIILIADTVPLNATFVDSGNGAGSFTFNPDYTQAGLYNITFIASDGTLADSELVAITVNDINRSPVLDPIGSRVVDEGLTLSFRVHATDPDLDSIILTADTVPLNATFVDSGNGAGSFTFNPDYTQAELYNVTFIASDGTLADSELVAITVNDINRSPVLDSIGSKSVDEGQALDFRISATDGDGDSIILSAENIPVNGTFVDSGNGAGSFTFNPDYDQAGVYNVTFITSDGSLADSELVAITVNDVNRAAVLDSIGSKSVDEGQTLEFRVSATDPDGDSIILTAANVPLNASFVDSGNGAGSFSFNPDYDQAGVYNVRFIASDGSLADSELVAITVNDVNRAPVAGAGPDQSGMEANTLVTLDGSGSYDPDGDSITYLWTRVSGPSVTLSDSTVVGPTFTPTVRGTYVFQLAVNDGSLDSQPDSVTISVNNQTPIADAGPDQLGLETNTLATLDGSGSYDPDGDSLSYEWIQISGPSVSLSDSTVVNPAFTPVLTGDYLFQLIVSDGLILSQPDTVLINVPAPPQAVVDLMATISGDSVLLTWSAVTADTSGKVISIDRYVIYRGTKAYFPPTPSDSIDYSDSSTLSFVDPGIGGANVVGDVDTNYYYVIKAVDVYGNYSDVSNRVGEYDYEILITSTTDFNYVTLPFTGTGITDADGLINSIGASNINNVNRFVQPSQSYEARFAAGYGTNFTVVSGGIYQVNAKNNTVWSIAGVIPAAGSISYSISTTPTTDFNFISIPFENEDIYQTAQDVIDSLPGALNTLNNFLPSSQSWESRFAAGYGTDFEVRPGGIYQANAKASTSFPPGE